MTKLEKNIAIAEMLGCTSHIIYENKTSGHIEMGIKGAAVKKWRNQGLFTGGFEEQMMASSLKFDTDANWQYIAMEWIEALDHSDKHYTWEFDERIYHNFQCYQFEVSRKDAYVWINWELDPSTILLSSHKNTKMESVFETLYQFSQYLTQYK